MRARIHTSISAQTWDPPISAKTAPPADRRCEGGISVIIDHNQFKINDMNYYAVSYERTIRELFSKLILS